ncbi:MAG TPA: aminotransferase class V-fold PLP-dependent enzyme [Polyangiaceae bacterium]|jgi:isopenicillin-N epimerase
MKVEFLLDPNITHLNHGAFGTCPRAVLEKQSELRAQLERNPLHFFIRELEGLLDETRNALAPFLGAQVEDLVFVRNATEGVNTVLASLPLAAGDEVLFTDHVYAACRNAAQYWAARRSAIARPVLVPFPLRSSDEIVNAVLAGVTAKTKLVLLDHVTSPTGLVMPIERLVRALSARGIETLVDGAHAPGMLPLSLEQLGASYYTGNFHKWCFTPKGAAFLWVPRERQAKIRPLVISHGASATRTDRSRFLLEFDWMGSADPSAILSIPSALRVLENAVPGGAAGLRARNHALVLAARDALCEALGSEPPCPNEMLGSLAAVLLPERTPTVPTPEALYTALRERHRIETFVVAWPGRASGFVRVAAQLYNSLEQYQRLASALKSELGLA